MKKHFKFFMALATCLTMGLSATACDLSFLDFLKPDEEQPEPLATVETVSAEDLASINEQGVTLYNLATFQPTGETATLETAYVFSMTETLEEAQASEYANWTADYYVSLNQAVEAGKIGLAGSYDSFADGAWIAFYSPIAVEANQEVPLLGSVQQTENQRWTYAQVAEFVGTFRCGAFDLDNACSGMTLKVELRLTNPEDANDKLTVNVTEYTFA